MQHGIAVPYFTCEEAEDPANREAVSDVCQDITWSLTCSSTWLLCGCDATLSPELTLGKKNFTVLVHSFCRTVVFGGGGEWFALL